MTFFHKFKIDCLTYLDSIDLFPKLAELHGQRYRPQYDVMLSSSGILYLCNSHWSNGDLEGRLYRQLSRCC